MACHCTGCQKMTASAFSLSALVSAASFAVTLGEPVIGGLHGANRHFFCPFCMSWMFTRPYGLDDLVNVRTTMLDDPGGLEPFMETWTSEKLPWAATPAIESFTGFPARQDLPSLLRAYAEQATPAR